jgi:hypothetical protein
MSVMTPAPKDAPVMVAWEAYKLTDEYQNTRKWALHERHVDGSLWAAFSEGFARSLSSREAVIEECIAACNGEQLTEGLDNEADVAYMNAIDDCIRAIRALSPKAAK